MARLRTLAEWMDLEGDEALTAPERYLIECCREGRPCTLGDGTRPDGPDPARTIRADLLRYLILGGCEDCRLDEAGVQLQGAYIPERLILDFGTAKGQTFLVESRFAKGISALQTRFQLLNLGGSWTSDLYAQGVEVTGDVFLRNGFTTKGRVSFSSAKIGGQLSCIGGGFESEGDYALYAQNVEVTGPVFLRNGFTARGEVSLSGAKIGGQLACDGGSFENEGGDALNAQNVEVTGPVFLSNGFTAKGEVNLSGAKIGGQLACDGGSFWNDGQHALNAGRMRVKAQLFWRNVSIAAGKIDLTAAHVGDLVDHAESWPEGGRLHLDGFGYDRISGAPTDASTRLEWLRKGDRWNGEFFPQPYTQLAKVLREMGHDRAARKVMIRKEELVAEEQFKADRARVDRLWNGAPTEHGDIGVYWLRMHLFRIWNFLIRWLVGYGYAPQLSLYWAAGTMAFMTVFYFVLWRAGGLVPNSALIMNSSDWAAAMAVSPTAPGPVWAATAPSGAHYETFYAGFYAADVFIPLINFGQEAAWAATTRNVAGWFAFLATFAFKGFGWFITALGAAAIGGIIRRE